MTRQQLAACAGVTSKTLGNYINRHWDELWALGMRPYEILPLLNIVPLRCIWRCIASEGCGSA